LRAHCGARFFRRLHDDVAAPFARVGRVGLGARTADRLAGHPHARPADFPERDAVALRERPWAVLEDRDVSAGSDTEMEVELAEEILPVAMAVEKTREQMLAGGIDDSRVGRNLHLATPADRAEASILDDDHRIGDRRPASAVDQRAALHDERLSASGGS